MNMFENRVTNYPKNLFVDWALKYLAQPCVVNPVRSGAHSSVYSLKGNTEMWFLKIADDLSTEIQKLQWLQGVNLATPTLVAQKVDGSPKAVLTSAIIGTDLAELSSTQSKEVTIKQLAQALKQFHETDASKCPFKAYAAGNVLVHGDACLPNIIYNNSKLSGFVDLLDMGVGSIEVDLSAAIWSLQYNLGVGYGKFFLEEYGHHTTTDDEVSRLYDMYENSPIFER